MKKSFVKLLLSGAMVLAGFAFVGCNDLDTEIAGINDRLTALEAEVDALQAAIDGGAVITSVDPTTNGVKVTLSNGKDFELTNGANGANGTNGTNGTNGKDGSVVTIGENGNWFIDGKDTNLAAEGKDGKEGADGKDATQIWYYPHEDGTWYKVTKEPGKDPVEEDTKQTWLPEGTVTAVWTGSSLVLYNVEGLAEGQEYLEIVLPGAIKSLAYVPQELLDSRGVIDFYSLYALVEDEPAFVVTAPTSVTYRVNPASADLTGVEWGISTRGVKTRAAEVASIDIVNVAAGRGAAAGKVIFDLVANGELPAYCAADEVAGTDQVLASLVAVTPEGEVIYSDEAYAQQAIIDTYCLINSEKYYDKDGNVVGHDRLSHNWPAIGSLHYGKDLPEAADSETYDIQLVYNSSINLYDYVETLALVGEDYKTLDAINVPPTYVFTKVDKYLGADGVTNQQKFVTLAEDGTVKLNSEWLANGGRAAIDRTPAFKVDAQITNAEGKLVTVATAYIIVGIVEKPAEEIKPLDPIVISGSFEYTDLLETPAYPVDLTKYTTKNGLIALDWETVNAKIYDVLGMSHTQFLNAYKPQYGPLGGIVAYDADGKKVMYEDDVDGSETVWAPGIMPVYGWENASTSTTPLAIVIDYRVAENTSGAYEFTYVADGYPDVVVRIEYAVSHNHQWPALNPDYTINPTTVQTKGKKLADNTPWQMITFLKEHFANYDYTKPVQNWHSAITFDLPYLDETGKVDDVNGTPQVGAAIDEKTDKDGYVGPAIYLTAPLEADYVDYVVRMTTVLKNGNKCTNLYNVRFVSPFTVALNDVTLKTFIANPDSADLNAYVVIADGDKNAIVEYDATTKTLALTDVAKNVYGLTTVPGIVYSLVYDVTGQEEATFGKNLNILTDGKTIEWYNDGTDLQKDKAAHYQAVVTFENICKLTKKGNVKVLSTANSK